MPQLEPILEARCAQLRARRRRLTVLCARAAHAMHGLHGELGFARARDYAEGRLGVPQSSHLRAVRIGRCLHAHPELTRLFRNERFGEGALDLLSTARDDEFPALLLAALRGATLDELRRRMRSMREPDALATHADTDDEWLRLRVRMPQPAAALLERCLELARAQFDGPASANAVIEAVLAEVLSEGELEVSGAEALLQHRGLWKRLHAVVPPQLLPRSPEHGTPPPRPHSPGDARGIALLRDRRLRRLLRAQAAARVHFEGELLRMQWQSAHVELGYVSFAQFAAAQFGLSRSRCQEMLARARLLQREEPIALARAVGQLGAIACSVLAGLKHLGLPPSAQTRWIAYARQHTTRQLQLAVQWARRVDAIEWASQGWPPPDESEVRIPKLNLEALSEPFLLPDPTQWDGLPQVTVEWVLEAATATTLLQWMSTQRRAAPSPEHRPTWFYLLQPFALAYAQWLGSVEARPSRLQRILERDDHRCAVPHCSSRRCEIHHIEYRSRGGNDDPSNLITLCPFHHRQGEHGGRLRIRGQADPDARSVLFELAIGPDGVAHERFRGDVRILACRRRQLATRTLRPATAPTLEENAHTA